jgi:two-component sensor histidine kinase
MSEVTTSLLQRDRVNPDRGDRDLPRRHREHRTQKNSGGPRALGTGSRPIDAELEFRCAAMRAGIWLGWLSIVAVLAALALGLGAQHRAHLFALTALAAAAHAVAMVVPWRRWLVAGRGQLLLDLWTAGLIGFVLLLVLLAGARANFDLLLFLILPFIVTVQAGRRRGLWLTIAALTFAAEMTLAADRLDAAAIAMRAALLAAAVVLALTLARATRREASARAEATARAELEHALLAEAHHRVKNSLQTVADLLLLARPAGGEGRAFDETASRIRSIAAVHRLLAEEGGATVGGDAIVRAVAAALDPAIHVETDPVELDAARAQQLGVVANELISNALRHGRGPVEVQLRRAQQLSLVVDDAGPGFDKDAAGLGLRLVRQIVENGLAGSFSIRTHSGGGTRAEIAFRKDEDADPDRRR